MLNLETMIAASLNHPQRNIYGDIGPRCEPCSGLGRHFRFQEGRDVRRTERCRCGGHGIDTDRGQVNRHIERLGDEHLWRQIHAIESRSGLPLTSRFQLPKIVNDRQAFVGCINASASDGAAVASTTTETIIFPNITIGGYFMHGARALRLKVMGKYGTHSSGTVTHVYRVRYGGVAGTVLTASGTVTLLVSLTNCVFEFEVIINTRSEGTSGTLMANGDYSAYGGTAPTIGSATGSPACGPMTVAGQTGPAASAAVDLTVDWALAVTIQHGASQAANTATGLHYNVEALN